jgi:hypothetical protein
MSDLARSVAEELSDEKYFGQSHYDRNTYYNGCRGPLCRKAERDNAAKKYAEAHPDRKARARKPEAIARDAYLNQVLAILRSQTMQEVS